MRLTGVCISMCREPRSSHLLCTFRGEPSALALISSHLYAYSLGADCSVENYLPPTTSERNDSSSSTTGTQQTMNLAKGEQGIPKGGGVC